MPAPDLIGDPEEERAIDFEQDVARRAAERWQARQKSRQQHQEALAAGRVMEVESQERIQQRLNRLSAASTRQPAGRSAVLGPAPSLVETVGLERVLGSRDFMGIDFLEMALAVSRFVGRILIRSAPGRTAGYGTGFMVSPRLMITNHHVLGSADDARHSVVEFDYQQDRFRRLLPVKTFALEPGTFFLTDRDLDFSLVAVAQRATEGAELARYSWVRLIGEQGKALLGDSLNIIQHPRGRVKEIVLRSNQLVDLFDDFAHYVTDTEPGSSGSPVFNDQWEVVGLHHSGVPAMKDGEYLAHDGSIWRPGMDADLLQWVANEGIRVSSLVRHLRAAALPGPEQQALREELLDLEPPHPLEVMAQSSAPAGSAVTPADPSGRPAGAPAGQAIQFSLDGALQGWTIPLQISVTLGSPTAQGTAPAAGVGSATAAGSSTAAGGRTGAIALGSGAGRAVEEAVSIDPDYRSRQGYDPGFLGPEHPVPLPGLSRKQRRRASVNREARRGADPHVLPYHHYSVVMNRERRLAFFTAVNIDGQAARRPQRERDRWFFDPRIPLEDQAGNEVYSGNPLDRGHLVRRLDPAWGKSAKIAKVANDDTFHYTNCAPQHASFNRSQTTWAGVEDYILDNADAHDLRVSVFTGPVFREDDPPYRGVSLPQQFWKVVVVVKEDGRLSATGYLLSQASLIEGMAEEAFAFGAFRTFQVPVRQIAELTHLDLGDLAAADPLAASGLLEAEGAPAREVRSFADLVL